MKRREAYALGADAGETGRLRRQSEELRPEALALLDRIGLRPGQAAIDLGCGPSGILDVLADRVGPGGRVVGLDANAAHVAIAADRASRRGLAHVTVMTGDARQTGLPQGTFDLVHARTLLVTIPDPAEVVAEMARLARPGGWVAGQEPDVGFALCYPPLPAWDRLLDLFRDSFSRSGADFRTGRRLAELLREAGIEQVEVTVQAPSLSSGSLAAHGHPRPGTQPAPGDLGTWPRQRA